MFEKKKKKVPAKQFLLGNMAAGPENRSFLFRMCMRKDHAMFVWATACPIFLSVSLSTSLSLSHSFSSMFFLSPSPFGCFFQCSDSLYSSFFTVTSRFIPPDQ